MTDKEFDNQIKEKLHNLDIKKINKKKLIKDIKYKEQNIILK